MLDLKKLKEYLDSEEGEEATKRLVEKWAKENAFRDRWEVKIKDFLEKQTDESLSVLFDKFAVHANKRSNILWDKGFDGETSLYSFLFNVFAVLGVESDAEWGMFTTGLFDWRGYRIELYCGQGSFHSLSKI
jgi:hypothetical protein